MPITGRPAVGDLPDGGAEAGALQIARGLAEVAHARHQHPVGPRAPSSGSVVSVAVCPPAAERAHDALQIVDAIVHHGNHSVPLVDGTPTTRGSTAVASSSARANALNAASTM